MMLPELMAALLMLRAGRREEIDPVRMLELAERLQDAGEEYFAAMAIEIANQAARP